jgi:hypothetical protein
MNDRTGKTVQEIKAARTRHQLPEIFSPADVNRVLGITFAGVFLPKHRQGNPGGNSERFVRVSEYPALYRLIESSWYPRDHDPSEPSARRAAA